MEFRILGPTQVLDGGEPLPLPSGRGRSLLALLALHAGEPVSADRLIDELWGEGPPPTARTVVHGLVSRLRRVLVPHAAGDRSGAPLQTTGSGYRLAIDPDAVDAHRFKRLIDEAGGAPAELRAAKLSSALALWRGPALVDFAYEPFAQRAVTVLEELRIQATEDRIEADLSLGHGAGVVPELEELIREHPFRERLRGFLMLALYRTGRQAEALRAYRDARSTLVEELGLEPGPALRELEMAILRQDRALEVPSTGHARTRRPGSPGSWLPRERRTVTVAVVDVAIDGSDDMDAEAVGRLGAEGLRVSAEAIERHGGRVETELGDRLIAFFGFPVAHEDDALRAVRAVADARAAVVALNDGPSPVDGVRYGSRAGIEAGDIVVAGPAASLRDAVAGAVVRAAGRLQQSAPDGELLVGAAAQRLLAGAVIMKPFGGDSGGTTTAWQVLEIVPGAPAIPRALDAPMFGRQDELTRLRSAFRRAVRSRIRSPVTVLGEAGLGKSRLARELVSSIGAEADTITLRCPAPSEGIAFHPVRGAVIESAGFLGWRGLHRLLAEDHDGLRVPPDVAAAIGLRAHSDSVAVLLPAMRRLLTALASRRPLIVVLEDLHWADPAFLDLVDDLTREPIDRTLLLCLGRPELIERRPGWAVEMVELDRLSTADVESLVLDRAGSITPDDVRRIVDAAEGNPLFAEQLLVALEDGTFGTVPATLAGLLSMRLDRLGPGERDLLRCASIVGLEFELDAVATLLPPDAHPFLERHLEWLAQRRFIKRTGPTAFRFGHALIRMAAYQSVSREDRAALHEQFAERLRRASRDATPGLQEILVHHLARAVDDRRTSGISSSP